MKQATAIQQTFKDDIFSQDFWANKFFKETQNGVAPYLFKGVLPQPASKIESVTRAFRGFQNPKTRDSVVSHARVYINEERRDDMMNEVLDAKFLPDETLCKFVQRITNEERFSLIINNFEQLCPELSASIGEFLQCMFSVRGAPVGGCEQVVFAGNYSGTAFGVHEGYEHAFLVHLGPGVKEFYCWSQETYLKLTKGSRAPTYGDYSWMLEYGEKFILEPGDILYLPALVYHVGRQTDFSISVAVPIYTYPDERFFTKVIAPGLSTLLPFNLEGMSEHVQLENGSKNFTEKFTPVAKTIFSEYMRNELSTVLAYRWNRLVSNGFWEISDNYTLDPMEEYLPDSNLVVSLARESRLRLIPPYKACWERSLNCSQEEIRVFIRANSVVLPFKQELIPLLEKLNEGKAVSLADDWQVSIFDKLWKTGGLQKE